MAASSVKTFIKNKLEGHHHPEFVFPVSNRTQTRCLVLRNVTNDDLAVKLRSSTKMLRPATSRFIVRSNEWVAIPVQLHVEGLMEKVELQFQSLSIFCRRFNPHPVFMKWFKDDSDNARYLIQRVKGFAAMETVVDLPGASTLIETPPFATVGLVDDADCQTAHGVDSDTNTAAPIEPEHWGAIAADSAISTAHRIDEGMPTARDINDRGMALCDALKSIFPAGAKKPAAGNGGGSYCAVFPCGSSD